MAKSVKFLTTYRGSELQFNISVLKYHVMKERPPLADIDMQCNNVVADLADPQAGPADTLASAYIGTSNEAAHFSNKEVSFIASEAGQQSYHDEEGMQILSLSDEWDLVAESMQARPPQAGRAFQRLFAAHSPRMEQTIHRIVTRQDSEDVMQTTALRAWRSIQNGRLQQRRGRELESTGPWFSIIAHRSAIDLFRSQQMHRRTILIGHDDPVYVNKANEVQVIAPSAEEIALIGAGVVAAIQMFCKTAGTHSVLQQKGTQVVLWAVEGLQLTEVAERMGIPFSTIKSRHSDIRRILGPILENMVDSDTI